MEEYNVSMSALMKWRAVTGFLTAENVPPIDINRPMNVIYGEECVDMSPVRCWAACVRDGKIEHVSLNLSGKRQSARP